MSDRLKSGRSAVRSRPWPQPKLHGSGTFLNYFEAAHDAFIRPAHSVSMCAPLVTSHDLPPLQLSDPRKSPLRRFRPDPSRNLPNLRPSHKCRRISVKARGSGCVDIDRVV
jgi:hypothetical protein